MSGAIPLLRLYNFMASTETTFNLHPVLGLRMSGAIPLLRLYNFMASTETTFIFTG
jgi:hypothetical protein